MTPPQPTSVLSAVSILLLATGCATTQRLDYEKVDSPAMDREMDYAVYLPPDYSPEEELPLVVFLHGGGDDHRTFDQAGVGQQIDRALREERTPRAVVVVPNGEFGLWVNWHDGSQRWEDWVVDDLIPHARETYNTRDCPDGCHLMGISMGGFGSLHMAMNNPETFATVTPMSAPIMNTEEMIDFREQGFVARFMPVKRIFGPLDRDRIREDDVYAQWTKPEDLHGMELMLAWGDEDREGIRKHGARFHQHLREHGIPHDLLVYPGGHGWASWDAVIVEALRRQVGDACASAADDEEAADDNAPAGEDVARRGTACSRRDEASR